MNNPPKLAVAWNGLPAYGAQLIRAGQERLNYDFPVIATKPDVPIQGMEETLKGNVTWIDPKKKLSWSDLKITIPDVFIHTGWNYPYFLCLANEVRANGGQVVGMFDNCWKRNLRQFLGGIYFRFDRRSRYAAAWVPGKSGRKLAKYIGFPNDLIFEGMYGADPHIFHSKVEAHLRPKRILFVGRLNDRKGVLELANAFTGLHQEFPDWSLEIVGSGPLRESLPRVPSIKLRDFQQPPVIASLMNQSRILVLPSREEHWGLVVHEAALCGCALALEERIGSAADFTGKWNAVLFKGTKVDEIQNALRSMFEWDNERLDRAAEESICLSKSFGPKIWAKRLEEILRAI